jgi:hypothetical protein
MGLLDVNMPGAACRKHDISQWETRLILDVHLGNKNANFSYNMLPNHLMQTKDGSRCKKKLKMTLPNFLNLSTDTTFNPC